MREVALHAQPTAGAHQVVDALVAAQRGLHRPLAGDVGAKAHVREHVEPLDVVACGLLVARHHHPARAVAAGAVGLGQRVEGQRQHIGRQAGHGHMHHVVIQHLVIDLIGKDHQAVLARDLDNALEQVGRIQRARGVVRVDDHDALGARRDLGADVVEVGHPAVGLVADVMHRRAAREAGRGGPQRIVGRGQQQFVAVVQQRIGGHHDQLGGTVAQVDVIERHALDALVLGLVHHRLARREDALAVRVAGRIRQVANHVLLDLFGRIEAEHRQIADVELDDLVPVFLHLLGRVHDGPADVITDVGKFGGFLDGLHAAMSSYCRTRQRVFTPW